MGDMFRAIKSERKQRKANNLQTNTEMLTELGIEFESCNAGYHLIISHNNKLVDFWPSSEKWKDRSDKVLCGGMAKLLKHLRVIL